MKPLFNRASTWVKKRFGQRIQKIPIDAGFTCPNRDGKLSDQGCLYCSNRSFSPFYCNAQLSISEQLSQGRKYFANRYGCTRFFAYFQAYSNTYAPVETLRKKYQKATGCEGIAGLIIATRPDCVNDDVVNLLREIADKFFVRIELGVESFDDQVLANCNRCHDVKTSIEAITRLRKANLPLCTHLISGLPGEKSESMKIAAQMISSLGIDMVKLHHLQIIRGSLYSRAYLDNPASFSLHTLDGYIDEVCKFISYLAPDVYLDRFINRVPIDQLLAPVFDNIDEAGFQTRLEKRLQEIGMYQGCQIIAAD
jgi:radical SAM protein (TIGR01212 family)